MSIDRKLVLSRLLSFLATSDRPDGKAFIDLARIGQTLSNDQLVKDIVGEKHAFPAARGSYSHFEAGMGSVDIQLDD